MKRVNCFLMIMLLVLSCMLSVGSYPLMVQANDTPDVVLGDSSDPISVIFSGTDGRIKVIENATGMTWSNGISGGGDTLSINTVTGTDKYNLTATATTQNGYSITIELKLDSSTGDLWVELSNESASIPNGILYPYAFFPGDGLGNAVIPINEGYLFPTTETSVAGSIGIPVLSHRRMEWFGGTDADNNKSWICILETPDDVYLNGSTTVLSNGNSYLGGVPKWIGSNNNGNRTLDLLSYTRKVRFHFFPSGGYVGLAKYFRQYASDKGWVKTLTEKNSEDPEHKTDKIIGAPIFYLWGDGRSISMLNELKNAGIEKAITNISVNQLDQHKAFPCNESTENDVWAKAAREQGYVPGFYDIYQAITSGKPKYDGTVYLWPEEANPNWFYVDAAGNRRAREVSQEKAYPFARDIRIPAHVNQFDIDAYLFDTTCAAALKFEDYDPLHPASRGDDVINRRNLLNAGYDNPNISRRLITGSEQARSWAVPYLHWAEGVSWLGSIDVQGKIPQNDLGRWNDVTYPAIMTDPIDVYNSVPDNNKLNYLLSNSFEVPLWELVYHDCIVTTQHWERTHNKYVYGWDKADMMAMLRGQAPIMNLTYQGEQGQANRTPEVVIDSYGNRWSTLWSDKEDSTNFVRNRVLKTYNNVSKWHEQVGYMEMTEHKILTADYSVQMSEFSDDGGTTGKGIIINFGVYDGEYGMTGADWTGTIRGVEYTIPVGEWVMFDFSNNYEDDSLTTLTGSEEVGIEEQFELTYGLDKTANITAQNVTFSYDKDLFEFVSVKPAVDGIIIQKAVTDYEIGMIRLNIASLGVENAISGNSDILNITFNSKGLGSGNIELTAAYLSNSQGEVIRASTISKNITMVGVDKTALTTAITISQGIYNNAVEGLSIGQYPEGTKECLNTAIIEAISVRDKTGTTAEQIMLAVKELNASVSLFQSLIITGSTGDINNIPGYDIGDLGIAASYYGKKEGDSDWDLIKRADIDGNGEIGTYDLEFISNKILDN